MKKNLLEFYKESLKKFGEATINIFVFLPYFFSVSTLLKTLFYPWKNLRSKKEEPGFTFDEWANRFAFNFISRIIGLFMRSSIISFYFLFQTLFMIFLPFVALFFYISIPIFYLIYKFKKSPEEQKKILKEKFIKDRLLDEVNRNLVEAWFENYYKLHLEKIEWWKLSNLFTFPPLARDWAMGYSPTLDRYTIDLASGTYLHHIKNIIGREKEIAQIELILSKNEETNVVIVGSEGVGKHTIIDALAKKIYLGKTNVHLMYKRILKLNMEKIGDDDKFLEDLFREANDAGNIILFIDNIEKYLEKGITFEKFAKSNSLQLIGITTPFLYQKFIFADEKMNRLFNKIDVYEVSKKEALEILLEKSFDFESYHQVIIPYETLVEVIEKSEFYLTYIPFPEKAVDLLDSACVFTKSHSNGKKPKVLPSTVDTILFDKTHIPMKLTSEMKEKLVSLENLLHTSVFEQNEAINKLSSALRRSFLLIGKRKKPLATFLFLGPTGVGKTQTAKSIASVFFSLKNLIRFDMSNYQSKYDIPILIGDINNKEPGLLAAAIRDNPYGVLLLDEIEKADHDLLNIFLTVIDEGYFTDGFGRAVDCKNLVIIATSNAKDYKVFAPEFINRFDGIVTFNELSTSALKQIANYIIEELSRDVLELHKIKLKIKEKTIDNLIEKGYDPKYGARNLERTIRDEIEDKVAKMILEEKVKPNGQILL